MSARVLIAYAPVPFVWIHSRSARSSSPSTSIDGHGPSTGPRQDGMPLPCGTSAHLTQTSESRPAHDVELGPRAEPDLEGVRCLQDQHLEAVGNAEGMRPGALQKRGAARHVTEIVGDGLRLELVPCHEV